MAAIPRLVTAAVHALDADEGKPLGNVDLTEAIVEHVSRAPALIENWLQGRGILVQQISNALPDDIRRIAWKGELGLPNFRTDLRRFVQAIGGPDAMPRLRLALREVTDAKWALKRAEEELEAVAQARFEPDLSKFDMLFGEHCRREFVSDVDEALDGWGWEDFVATDPQPGFDSPAYKAWEDRYEAWVRRNAPPYLFGTAAHRWKGVSAEEIREEFAANDHVDIGLMVENEMDQHFEDAIDHVVDLEGLIAAVRDWEPHARDEDEPDKALEAAVDAWNARQNLVSYSQDSGVIVPAFADATHAEAIAWCERVVEAAKARLAQAEDGWSLSPEGAPAPGFGG